MAQSTAAARSTPYRTMYVTGHAADPGERGPLVVHTSEPEFRDSDDDRGPIQRRGPRRGRVLGVVV